MNLILNAKKLVMENIFSLKRFWLLVRKQANENRTNFLYLIMIMFIPVIFVHIFPFTRGAETVFDFYKNSFLLVGGIYTGMFFKNWTYTSRAATVLMLPATTLEKIILVFFYTVVVLIPVITVVYYGSHFAISEILNPEIPFSFIEQYHGLSPLPAVILYVILPYTFLQSICLLFSVWFNKRQIVMAFGAILIVFSIIGILLLQYVSWLSKNNSVTYTDLLVFYPTDLKYNISGSPLVITSPLITSVNILIIALSTLLIYLASYFKLKEKEI